MRLVVKSATGNINFKLSAIKYSLHSKLKTAPESVQFTCARYITKIKVYIFENIFEYVLASFNVSHIGPLWHE